MIVYVESNFVLELALLRNEHLACNELLRLSTTAAIRIAIPAFSVGEPYEAWVRRSKQRSELKQRLDSELNEMSRSEPYQGALLAFQELVGLLLQSNDDEKTRLDQALEQILHIATVIPIHSSTLQQAIKFQKSRSLKPQDSIIYASVLEHMVAHPSEPKCFVTTNSKDFVNPDITSDLVTQNCRLLSRFVDALGYVKSKI